MIELHRRAAAAAAILAVAVVAGCAPTKTDPSPAPGPVAASPDRVAALRDQYNKTPGVSAGVVEGVSSSFAAIDGIDPKVAAVGSPISFIDVSNNEVVCHGTVHSSSTTNRVIVNFTTEGEIRAPRAGDLAVKLLK